MTTHEEGTKSEIVWPSVALGRMLIELHECRSVDAKPNESVDYPYGGTSDHVKNYISWKDHKEVPHEGPEAASGWILGFARAVFLSLSLIEYDHGSVISVVVISAKPKPGMTD